MNGHGTGRRNRRLEKARGIRWRTSDSEDLIVSRRDSRSPPTSIARSQSRWRLASAALVFAASRLFRSVGVPRWARSELSLDDKLALRWAWRCGRGEQGRGGLGARLHWIVKYQWAFESVAEHAIRPVQACFGNHQWSRLDHWTAEASAARSRCACSAPSEGTELSLLDSVNSWAPAAGPRPIGPWAVSCS